MTKALGVVAALEMERRWIGAPEPIIETSGVGAEKAETAALRLLDRGATSLASWGVAGGLDPVIAPGTVVLPETVIGADGSRLTVDLEWRGRLLDKVPGGVDVSTAEIMEVDRPIATAKEKRELHRRTGAGAVDMESAAVASVAKHAGISFIAVRVVVDAAPMSLPAGTLRIFDERGQMKWGSLIRLVMRPYEWPGLIALARANAAAGRSMCKVWSAAEPDLGLS